MTFGILDQQHFYCNPPSPPLRNNCLAQPASPGYFFWRLKPRSCIATPGQKAPFYFWTMSNDHPGQRARRYWSLCKEGGTRKDVHDHADTFGSRPTDWLRVAVRTQGNHLGRTQIAQPKLQCKRKQHNTTKEWNTAASPFKPQILLRATVSPSEETLKLTQKVYSVQRTQAQPFPLAICKQHWYQAAGMTL